jgi:hypothetical protein
MLDAIVQPAWEFRYYSFDAAWCPGEQMASMRNGSGDHWFALVCSAGVALHGLAHEAPNFRPGKPWPGIFETLPLEFHDNFLREPAFDTTHSTFCIWRLTTQDRWQRGSVRLPAGDDPDGSRDLLSILDGDPHRYRAFASDYYERDLVVEAVRAIYRHEPLTEALVRTLNPQVTLADVGADAEEIAYPSPSNPR